MNKIKIFGERNTGTNYLSKLIGDNIEVQLLRGIVPRNNKFFNYNEFTKNLYFSLTEKNNLGWKHAFVDLQKVRNYGDIQNTLIVTLTKNPYSFLLSLYKKPYHYTNIKPASFTEFLTSKWMVQKRENAASKYFDSPIDLWNAKNRSYTHLKEVLPHHTYNLKYEDLLDNPQKIITDLADKHHLKLTHQFRNTEESTKNDAKNFSDYKKYYLNEEWKAHLDHTHLQIINEQLDKSLMEFFGYEVLQTVKA